MYHSIPVFYSLHHLFSWSVTLLVPLEYVPQLAEACHCSQAYPRLFGTGTPPSPPQHTHTTSARESCSTPLQAKSDWQQTRRARPPIWTAPITQGMSTQGGVSNLAPQPAGPAWGGAGRRGTRAISLTTLFLAELIQEHVPKQDAFQEVGRFHSNQPLHHIMPSSIMCIIIT